MKFDRLANSYMRLFTENHDASPMGPFSLYWKNEEQDDKANKWYTANTLKNLLQQVNQDNLTGDFEYGMVDEDREFMSVQELLDYCDNSSFFITDGQDKIVAGVPPWHWDNGSDEDAEEKKVKSYYGKLEFRIWAKGSKSESMQPFFIPKSNPPQNKTTGEYAWDTKPKLLRTNTDGTFTNSHLLRKYDGKNVVIKGHPEKDGSIQIMHIGETDNNS